MDDLQESGCLELHEKLLACQGEYSDWRKCKKEMEEFKKCWLVYRENNLQKVLNENPNLKRLS